MTGAGASLYFGTWSINWSTEGGFERGHPTSDRTRRFGVLFAIRRVRS